MIDVYQVQGRLLFSQIQVSTPSCRGLQTADQAFRLHATGDWAKDGGCSVLNSDQEPTGA